MKIKNNRLFINISLIIAKRVVYTLFYGENETVKNHVISYQIIKNIRLTLKFRKICSVFLNHHVNAYQTIKIVKKVMRGRPIVHDYMQLYRRDNDWHRNT